MHIRSLLHIFIVAVLIFQVSCSDESELSKKETDLKEIEFTLQLPRLSTPISTKTMTSAQENEVSEIDVLVFDVDASNNETFAYQRTVTSAITQTGTNSEIVKFRAWLKYKTNQNVIIIANARSAIGTFTVGDTKAAVLETLKISQNSKTAWATDGSKPIPMYGETGKIDVLSAANTPPSITLNLLRMLARIDVKSTSSDFTLEEVYLCNYNTSGYIAPSWASPATSTNIPSSAGAQVGSTNAIAYSGSSLEKDIYTFESASASDANGHNHTDRKNAICLVVKGQYNSQSYYYRIDFTGDDTSITDPSNQEYIPLQRNHKYVIDITEAEGIGYSTLEEALEAYTVISNLKLRKIVYDEATAKDVNFNGQYMLTFNDDSFVVDGSGGNSILYVTTDYPGGWTIDDVTDESGATISWLSLDKVSGGTYTTASGQTTTSVNITAQSIPAGADARVGYIQVTSGRLKTNIEVIQSAYPIEDPSNCYLIKPNASSPLVIPVIRAEQGIAGSLKRRNDFTGGFVWTDNKNGQGGTGSVDQISVYGKSRKALLIVRSGSTLGNSVISVSESNKIKWSWHIWTTDYDLSSETGVFMDRNLGALTNGLTRPSSPDDWWWNSLGLLYQWGRKDPFPYMYVKGSSPVSGTTATMSYFYTAAGVSTNLPHSSFSDLLTSVENPTLYSDAVAVKWKGSDGVKSWNNIGQKTVFDPCPKGWKVPVSLDTFDKNSFTVPAAGTWIPTITNASGSTQAKFTIDCYDISKSNSYSYYGWRESSNGGVYVPAGMLVFGSNSKVIVHNDAGWFGGYWTADVSVAASAGATQSGADVFKITETTIKDSPLFSYRDRGFSIRCIKE